MRPAWALANIAELQETGTVREVDAQALLLLLQMGVGAIAGASTAAGEIYGFDLDDPEARLGLASTLADILRLGLPCGECRQAESRRRAGRCVAQQFGHGVEG